MITRERIKEIRDKSHTFDYTNEEVFHLCDLALEEQELKSFAEKILKELSEVIGCVPERLEKEATRLGLEIPITLE